MISPPKPRALKATEAAEIYFALREFHLTGSEEDELLRSNVLVELQTSLKLYDTKNLIPMLRQLLDMEGQKKNIGLRYMLADLFCDLNLIGELSDKNDSNQSYKDALVREEASGKLDPGAVSFFFDIMRRALLLSLKRLKEEVEIKSCTLRCEPRLIPVIKCWPDKISIDIACDPCP